VPADLFWLALLFLLLIYAINVALFDRSKNSLARTPRATGADDRT